MREGKQQAKQEVMYIGNLKVVNTRFGQFVKGRRYDLDRNVAIEALKIPGIVVPYFLGKYVGSDHNRKIRVVDKVYDCPRGRWVKLPITIQYKIRADTQFQVGPGITEPKATELLKQQERPVAPVVKSHPKPIKIKKKTSSVPIITLEKSEEEIPKPKVALAQLGLSKNTVNALGRAGIEFVDDIPSHKKLLEIKGIGLASARLIYEKIKDLR